MEELNIVLVFGEFHAGPTFGIHSHVPHSLRFFVNKEGWGFKHIGFAGREEGNQHDKPK